MSETYNLPDEEEGVLLARAVTSATPNYQLAKGITPDQALRRMADRLNRTDWSQDAGLHSVGVQLTGLSTGFKQIGVLIQVNPDAANVVRETIKEIETIASKVQDYIQAKEVPEGEAEGLQTQVRELMRKNEQLAQETQALNQRNEELSSQLSQMSQEFNRTEEELTAATEETTEVKEALREAGQRADQLSEENKALRDRMNELDKDNDKLQKDLASLKKENQELREGAEEVPEPEEPEQFQQVIDNVPTSSVDDVADAINNLFFIPQDMPIAQIENLKKGDDGVIGPLNHLSITQGDSALLVQSESKVVSTNLPENMREGTRWKTPKIEFVKSGQFLSIIIDKSPWISRGKPWTDWNGTFIGFTAFFEIEAEGRDKPFSIAMSKEFSSPEGLKGKIKWASPRNAPGSSYNVVYKKENEVYIILDARDSLDPSDVPPDDGKFYDDDIYPRPVIDNPIDFDPIFAFTSGAQWRSVRANITLIYIAAHKDNEPKITNGIKSYLDVLRGISEELDGDGVKSYAEAQNKKRNKLQELANPENENDPKLVLYVNHRNIEGKEVVVPENAGAPLSKVDLGENQPEPWDCGFDDQSEFQEW